MLQAVVDIQHSTRLNFKKLPTAHTCSVDRVVAPLKASYTGSRIDVLSNVGLGTCHSD